MCISDKGNCWPPAHNVDVLVHLLIVNAGAGLKPAHGHLGLGAEGRGDMKTPRPGSKGQLDQRKQKTGFKRLHHKQGFTGPLWTNTFSFELHNNYKDKTEAIKWCKSGTTCEDSPDLAAFPRAGPLQLTPQTHPRPHPSIQMKKCILVSCRPSTPADTNVHTGLC